MPPALKRSSTYAEDIVKLNSAAPTDKDAYAVVTVSRSLPGEPSVRFDPGTSRLGAPHRRQGPRLN